MCARIFSALKKKYIINFCLTLHLKCFKIFIPNKLYIIRKTFVNFVDVVPEILGPELVVQSCVPRSRNTILGDVHIRVTVLPLDEGQNLPQTPRYLVQPTGRWPWPRTPVTVCWLRILTCLKGQPVQHYRFIFSISYS